MTEFTAGVQCIHAGCCADGTRNYQSRSFLFAALPPSVATHRGLASVRRRQGRLHKRTQVEVAEVRIGVVAKAG